MQVRRERERGKIRMEQSQYGQADIKFNQGRSIGKILPLDGTSSMSVCLSVCLSGSNRDFSAACLAGWLADWLVHGGITEVRVSSFSSPIY